MIQWLYKSIMTIGFPIIELILLLRVKKNKEDFGRLNERRGISIVQRPEGELIWVNASSVGESMAALSLIERLVSSETERNVLVTTGTLTSAQLMMDKLPDTAFQQFTPIDRPAFVKRFFKHWKPDLLLIMESEFWPVQIHTAKKFGIPIIAVNARLSEKSFLRWRIATSLSSTIFEDLSLVISTNKEQGSRFSKLGARNVVVSGNLKRSAPKLDVDQSVTGVLSEQIGNRPVWLAASTHIGEDRPIMEVANSLLDRFPNLLTIVAPRHPSRGKDIAELGSKIGLKVARRSCGEEIVPETQLYIADTLGEMGLFFHISDTVFVAGSLVPVGGHNPIEPAHFDCAIIFGNLMSKNQEIADEMLSESAAIKVHDNKELFNALAHLLSEPEASNRLAQNAKEYANNGYKVLESVSKSITAFTNV